MATELRTSPAPILSARDLRYQYPGGKTAIQSLSLDVLEGEKVGLLGPTGSGKTTALLVLLGVLEGTGKIAYKGKSFAAKDLEKVRSFTGILFQNPDDQLYSKVVEDIVASDLVYQGLTNGEIKKRVDAALDLVGIKEVARRRLDQLSGGQRKKVAIASILAAKPDFLILDEPCTGLDPQARLEFIDMLCLLPKTMLVLSHDPELIARLTERVYVLSEGQIVRSGNTREILADQALMFDCGIA